MKEFLRIACYFILLLVMTTSCHEDLIEEMVITEEITPITRFEVDIRGLVSDDEGNPISNVFVQVEGQTFTTDSAGFFQIMNVEMNSGDSQQIIVEAEGFLPVSRLINIISENEIEFNISMISIPPEVSFNAQEGFVAQVSESATITFFENGILSDGEPFNGTVNLRAFHLAKDDEQLFDRLPGDLIGVDLDNSRQFLETFGMIYTVLEDENGNELQPDPSTTALLKIDIPEQHISTAPAQMPLWYFDVSRGVWIEEGIAIRNGNTYEGAVTHFSWWNMDVPLGGLLNVCVTVTNENTGQPFSNTKFIFENEIVSRTADTDEFGELCIILQPGVAIEVKLFEECGISDVEIIGPFSFDQNNIDVSLGVDDLSEINISGIVTECTGTQNLGIELMVNRNCESLLLSGFDFDGSNYNFNLPCPVVGDTLQFIILDINTRTITGDEFIIDDSDADIVFGFDDCDKVDNFLFESELIDDGLNSGVRSTSSFSSKIESVQLNSNETILNLDLEGFCFLTILGSSIGTFEGSMNCGFNDGVELTVTIEEFDDVISGTYSAISGDIVGTFSALVN